MAWQDDNVLVQGKELLSNSTEQNRGVASRQIPSTYATCEEYITADQQFFVAPEET